MIQNSEVSRYNLVLQNSPSWDVNPISMVCNDDHGPT